MAVIVSIFKRTEIARFACQTPKLDIQLVAFHHGEEREMTSRRSFVLLSAAASTTRAFAPGDFWNDKKAEDWSEKDVQKLLTHSPWAKEVSVDLHMAGPGGGTGGRGGRTG